MACLNLLDSDAKQKLKVLVFVGLTFFLLSFGPEFWLLIGDTFVLLTAPPSFAQTFIRSIYMCARLCVCVCVCVC